MSRRPTIAELRGRVFKPGHERIGNWQARSWGRPSAIYGTWLALRLGLSAHAVTLLALLASLGGAVAVAGGTRAGFVAGAGLGLLAFWLDHVDGQVARWRGTASLGGVYFDYLMHHTAALATGFALGYGLAARSGDLRWTAAGLLVGGGWLFLGLHNDCRYKAFFERLKAGSGSYRVDCGAGGSPSRAPGWPRRGLGMLSWPLAKACEPHVVLLTQVVLATLAIVWPRAWLAGWRLGVLGMAVAAPALAAARAARAIARRDVDTEFGRWFRPIDEG